uniref:Metalloendopeptidase n=1 Tax=Meloidogyne javanica TaxID=6303 RepID=A0A915LQB0_MELJA
MKRQYHRLKDTKQFNQRYDYGSVMHYPPEDYRSGIFEIISLMRDYQSTMGQRIDISFKDAKILNLVYCTSNNPHIANYAKCNPEDYKLNNGNCKNGGYPNPINKCKCRCPPGYDGPRCTSYKYKNSKAIILTPTTTKQYFKVDDQGDYFWIVKRNIKSNDRIPSKYTIVSVEKLDGVKCRAQLCCGSRLMPIVVKAESDTDVIITKHGKGKATIGYLAGYTYSIIFAHRGVFVNSLELTPSTPANTCKNVNQSIIDEKGHPDSELRKVVDEPLNGPKLDILCVGDDKRLTINGHIQVKFWDCYTGKDRIKYCGYGAFFRCKVLSFYVI